MSVSVVVAPSTAAGSAPPVIVGVQLSSGWNAAQSTVRPLTAALWLGSLKSWLDDLLKLARS